MVCRRLISYREYMSLSHNNQDQQRQHLNTGWRRQSVRAAGLVMGVVSLDASIHLNAAMVVQQKGLAA